MKDELITSDLPLLLERRLRLPLPGRAALDRFAPALAYGRHSGPAAADATAAAVLALLYPRAGEWHLPLTLRPANMPAHPNQISFPGGVTEGGESPEECAARELEEELGVRRDAVRFLGRLSPLYIFGSNFWVTPCVAVCEAAVAFRPNADEVAELLELPARRLLDPEARRSHEIERKGVRFIAPHIEFAKHRIWGATSMMLGELAAALNESLATA
jgi:8-oxo-dGTP pyrophosphatase MutT (NUDIX family)